MKFETPRKNQIISIVTVIAIVVLIIIFWRLFQTEDRIVSVTEFEGTTGVQKQAGTKQQKDLEPFLGMRIEKGDVVWTKQGSSVTMMVDADKVIRLEEDSQASFTEIVDTGGQQITVIDLKRGTLINDLKEKLKDNITYKITTPNATVSVRGTYFVVYVGEEEGYEGVITKVNVYGGTVAVESLDGMVTILHGNEEGAEWVQWESGVEIPSGNRAIVGTNRLFTWKGVDFSGLKERDLDRLEEIVRKGETALMLSEIMEQREKLGQTESEEIPETESESTSESEPISGTEEAAGIVPKPKKEIVPEIESNSNQSQEVVSPDLEIAEEGIMEQPTQTPETEAVEESTSGGDSTGNTEQGNSENPQPESTLDVQKRQYAPAWLQLANQAQLEQEILTLKEKRAVLSMKAASQSVEASINAVDANLATVKTKIDNVASVNGVLNAINTLHYPCEVQETDRVAIEGARQAYNNLSAECQALVPSRMTEKLAACEVALP